MSKVLTLSLRPSPVTTRGKKLRSQSHDHSCGLEDISTGKSNALPSSSAQVVTADATTNHQSISRSIFPCKIHKLLHLDHKLPPRPVWLTRSTAGGVAVDRVVSLLITYASLRNFSGLCLGELYVGKQLPESVEPDINRPAA